MAPRGRKVKEGIANQMDVYNGNKGLTIMLLRGGIKKKWFFLLLVKKFRPPPPPFFDRLSFF